MGAGQIVGTKNKKFQFENFFYLLVQIIAVLIYWLSSTPPDATYTVDSIVRIATRYRRIGNGIQSFRFCFWFWMFRMTVDEHLWFYARLKGMPEQDVQREMDQ